MKRLVLVLAFAAIAFAQRGTYFVTQKTSLSGAAEAVTIQLAAASTKVVELQVASVYCSVECEFTVEKWGTLATTTAITPVTSKSTDQPVSATAYRSSNVGSSTVVSRHVVPAGLEFPLDMSSMVLHGGENVTIRTASITGNVIINFQWREHNAESY